VNFSDLQREPLPVGTGSMFRRTFALAACRLANDIFGAPGIVADQLQFREHRRIIRVLQKQSFGVTANDGQDVIQFVRDFAADFPRGLGGLHIFVVQMAQRHRVQSWIHFQIDIVERLHWKSLASCAPTSFYKKVTESWRNFRQKIDILPENETTIRGWIPDAKSG
jgi:hypothetical protein